MFPENLQWKQNVTNMCQWIYICTFQVYCLMWVKCSIRNLNTTVLGICEFQKISVRMVMPFLWVYIKLHLCSCQHPFLHLSPTTLPTFLKWLTHGNSSYVMLLLYSNYWYRQGTTTFLSINIMLHSPLFSATIIPRILWVRTKNYEQMMQWNILRNNAYHTILHFSTGERLTLGNE